MEFQFYCDELSKYYGLYVNESIFEVREHLKKIIQFYFAALSDLLLKEEDIDPYKPL